jgi:PAS domain S-box-containing protein
MAIHTSRRNPLGPTSDSNTTIAPLIDAIDWAKTPVGPRSTWPQSLRTSLSIVIDSGFPMVVMWGPELVLFYNSSYAPILGEKHPWAMGRPMREVWPEIWETIGPMLHGVMQTGVATYNEDLLLPLFRSGYLEECYFTFSYSPIADRDEVCGIFCAVAETSRKVIAERRLRTLHELETRAFGATDIDQACLVTAQVLAHNPLDVPFSRIYLFDGNERLRLRESSGPPATEREEWPIEEAARTLAVRVVPSTIESTSTLAQSSPVNSAIVLPIAAAGAVKALGAIVLGLSPFSAIDEEYRRFLELTAGQIAAAVQSAQAYQEAKSRAEALAELDRAKTAFFSNVSHEFRTPLTLLLGPIEHLLQGAPNDLDPKSREELQMARRNAYRLLKLVNQLLEFSRIEANRADASYEAADVARLSSDIASSFRSAVEQAGLTFEVDAPEPVPAYVDRAMWERILLNLLSNAVKSTFSGGITVRVWGTRERAYLQVSDTGVGIPQEELPTLFERFKRVRGAKSRTGEGTGIGLALVHELVGLHAGNIDVESTVGSGTSFTIAIPSGKAHLRSEEVVAPSGVAFSAERVAQYLEEVAGWLQGGEEGADEVHDSETILVVDDNPDLRSYLRRALSTRWNVVLADDGLAALEHIARKKPDLVISDIMMPGCSGIELLKRLRDDPKTKRLPVILLSARAGEEASIEGMQEGADDYIVKPFSAERLVARVEATLKAAKVRAEAVTIAERARDAAVESERILRMLADAIPQIVCTAAPNGVIDYFNRRWFEFTGFTQEQSLRKGGWRDAIHPDDRPALQRLMREAVERGNDFSLEFRVRSRTGEYRWFLARAVALRDDGGRVIRYFSTATDIDEQKRIEERETFLSRVSDELASTLDARAILQKITDLCIPTFCDWCQVSSLSDDELIVEAVSHIDPGLRERMQSLVGRNVIEVGNVALGSPQVLRYARSRVLDHAMTLRAVAENVPDPEDRATYEAAGLGTALIVPLVVRGEVRGTLHLVNMDPASRRPEITMEVAEELGRRAAVAIDNSRLYEREHRVASALQQAMLPANLPSHPRVELSYAYRPAERESRVGGDWYDAFMVSDNRVAVSIGDVGGHGLEAAVAMNEARHAIRLSALEGMSPAQTLRRTNAALMLNDEHPIITAVFGVIDVERSSFRYSCAGHPPPAIAPLSGRAHFLDGGGIPLGVDVAAPFPTLDVPLEPYATLLLYTDGLIEYNRNIERESARLLDALSARVQDFTADGAGALVRHVLDNRQLDDIAVLAATILPERPDPVALRLPAAPASAAIARRLAIRFARVAQLAPERTFDLTIAVGEAVANAVEHAYRGTTGDFVLRLSMEGETIVGEVEDLGTWCDANPDEERGRGLAILQAATSRLELTRSPHGTTVTFTV